MRAIVTIFVLAALVTTAGAEFKIWELVEPPPADNGSRLDVPWPADGAGQWHNIRPPELACTIGLQTGHDDQDGDGLIDVCENVQIDGVWEHIEWVGPTLYLYRPDTREQLIVEPVDPLDSRSEYHVVSPLYCAMVELPPDLQICDYITILNPPEFAGEWHIEDIRENIHTNGGSPVQPSTWGAIKAWLGNLF
jgi:hypothetical protein